MTSEIATKSLVGLDVVDFGGVCVALAQRRSSKRGCLERR